MENIYYPDMVKTLAKDGDVIAQELTGSDAHILHMAVGISGEAGKLLDAIKKATIYRKPLDLENVIEEFYMEGLRQELYIFREQTLSANIEKLGKRYEELKYGDSAAQNRADKQ